MKFPISMLRDFVQTDLNAEQIGDLLTMTGFELEEITEVEGEPVLDVNIMSNRGDGLSVFGLAREVLAKDVTARATELYQRASARFPADQPALSRIPVKLETTDCDRYAYRLFENIEHLATPEKIQKRLRQAGLRPISLFVDLTNYLLLELGQPLHAFDLDTLNGHEIVVRKARDGEKLTTLNEEEKTLQTDQMMICDAERPVAAAGIMGGLDTEVTGQTRNVLLESAHFLNSSIRRTRKQLGLSTEASYRFERSVDPEGVVGALNRFAELLAEVDGGKSAVPGVCDVRTPASLPAPIDLDLNRAQKLLGMEISEADAKGYLERLGFSLNGWSVTPPTWRIDIIREEDLIEELGRVHGYEKIPELLPPGTITGGGAHGLEAFTDHLRECVLKCGFDQVMSHSLRDTHPLDHPITNRIGPRNPGSPDMAYLRDTLLPSLAAAARRNGGKDLHLFEIGRVFGEYQGKSFEQARLALWSQGALENPHWQKSELTQADFFSLKGITETIADAFHIELDYRQPKQPDTRFHPTKQAGVYVKGTDQPIGGLGQIHPDLAEELGIPEETFMAEYGVEALYALVKPLANVGSISRNPSVRRDIALLIDKSTPYQEIEKQVQKAGGNLLEKQWLFDVYEGKGIPEGKHSLAIALQLRKQGENFTDEEANQVRERVVEALAELGGTTR